jgi:hypothetical protein
MRSDTGAFEPLARDIALLQSLAALYSPIPVKRTQPADIQQRTQQKRSDGSA